MLEREKDWDWDTDVTDGDTKEKEVLRGWYESKKDKWQWKKWRNLREMVTFRKPGLWERKNETYKKKDVAENTMQKS